MKDSSSLTTLFDLYKKAIGDYGYDRVMYSSVTNDVENDKNKTPCLIQNYPDDWMEFYTKSGFIQIDPVRRMGCFSAEPFTWENLKSFFKLSKKQELVLALGEEAGLFGGIGIPFHNKINREVIGVGIASSNKNINPEEHMKKLHILTTTFHTAYQSVLETMSHQKASDYITDISIIPLTMREKEVLLWSVRDKSNWDIAKILNISEHTVDFHIRNIFKKLSVNSKLAAVVKALYLGLIQP
jgi:DNA-binding CsgD family transcriptional regulator